MKDVFGAGGWGGVGTGVVTVLALAGCAGAVVMFAKGQQGRGGIRGVAIAMMQVCERERDRENERQGDRETERQVCV
jgi:hypothetical protein